MNIKTFLPITFAIFISLLSSALILHYKVWKTEDNISHNKNNLPTTKPELSDQTSEQIQIDKDTNANEEKTVLNNETDLDNNQIDTINEVVSKNILNLSANSGTILKNNQKLLEYNTDTSLPIASLTKIVTALVAIQNYNLDQKVTIPYECTTINAEYAKAGFKAEEVFYLEDLLYALLVSSSADAACAIESLENKGDFIKKMNDLTEVLGLSDTKFDNTIGIDSLNNYSTINDLVKIVNYAKQSETMIKITSTKEIIIRSINTINQYKLNTTNDLLISIPGVSGFKTGYTTQANECLILSYQNKMDNYTFIVLGSVDRFLDTTKMINYVLSESNGMKN